MWRLELVLELLDAAMDMPTSTGGCPADWQTLASQQDVHADLSTMA